MQKDRQPNQLFAEQSPYLLQHAYNPVNWYPWGEDALQKAADEHKLLIISVGYAACHWCHVMEKESFEDAQVAELMNQYFVSIKVDREERPDIDDIYMNACHLSGRRSCGWPLNAFALPDGRPFWASTYFPKDQWLDILRQIAEIKQNEPEKLTQAAEEIMKGIKQMSLIPQPVENIPISQKFLENACNSILEQQDFKLGGRQGQPKFPMPVIYQFLLRYHHYFNESKAINAVRTTLDNMMMGGIYDQLGGGFARYSVDSYWFAPHFEKMLYDNAQLVSLYAAMHRFSKNQEYKKVVFETLGFAEREWLTPEGIFYSALDADSEGEEGRYYVWKAEELRQAFNHPQDSALFFDYFQIVEAGNWENAYNILYRKADNQDIETKFGLTKNELECKIEELKSILFEFRSSRIRPLLDHKMLTSWNGLMLKAYTDAYKAFQLAEYKNNAIRMASFILENAMDKNYRLFRTFGRKKINGFLDDYANLIAGLIGLYEISFDDRWIFTAKNLTDYAFEHFYEQETGVFYFTSDLDPPLVSRSSEMTDNVIPGAGSVMSMNLYVLSKLFREERFARIADEQMQKVINSAERFDATFYANWMQLSLLLYREPFEISIVGLNATDVAADLMQHYLPDVVLSGTKGQSELPVLADKINETDKTLIYICRGNTCFAPVYSAEDAMQMIKNLKNESQENFETGLS